METQIQERMLQLYRLYKRLILFLK